MPKQARVPSYRLHKGSGQAVVVLDGKSIYLGKWNSPQSRSEYDRVLAEWLDQRHQAQTNQVDGLLPNKDISIAALILAFWTHVQLHYRYPDGRPTGEQDNLRHALKPLRKLYGHTRAIDFGPRALRAIQKEMIRTDLCRTVINNRVNRIRRAFRWAVSMELIPATILHALETVPPLRRGRSPARESPGVHPVRWEDVDATLPYLPRPVAAMVEVMRYSNCRAEDVVILRGCDLVMKGDTWEYTPANHKNAWREEDSPIHKRIIQLGPRCQDILLPFLKSDLEAYLFSPKEAKAEFQVKRSMQRKTKRTPSETKRKRKRNPKRAAGDRYSVNTFQQTIRKTCRKHKFPVWTVLQIRHTRASEVREQYGVEGAQASLGNARVETAQIYAEKNMQLARRIAQEIG
jgi:integrase